MRPSIQFAGDAQASTTRQSKPFRNLTMHGKRWCTRLKGESGLYGKLREENPIIVSYQTKDDQRLFGAFGTTDALESYIAQFRLENKHFHEVINLEVPHKLHFDVDISGRDAPELGEKTLKALLTAIRTQVAKIDQIHSPNACLRIYTSHSNDDSKYSYHVILDGYSLQGVGTYKYLFNTITSSNLLLKKYVDIGTCSSTHNLRMLGSVKLKSDRVKIYSSSVPLQLGLTVSDDESLSASLITYTDHCVPLDFKVNKIERAPQKDLLPEAVVKALGLIPDPEAFEVESVKSPIVALRRLRPSTCPTCRHDHEHENPYLILSSDGAVRWNCRRTKSSTVLGNVGSTMSDEVDDGKGTLYIEGEMEEEVVRKPPPRNLIPQLKRTWSPATNLMELSMRS